MAPDGRTSSFKIGRFSQKVEFHCGQQVGSQVVRRFTHTRIQVVSKRGQRYFFSLHTIMHTTNCIPGILYREASDSENIVKI